MRNQLDERVDGAEASAPESTELVGGVLESRDGEDLVELLERETLGLRDEEEDEEEADGVPAGIPEESAGRSEGVEEARERESDDLARRKSVSRERMRRGEDKRRLTKLKVQVRAVAYDMPTSRT